MMGWCFEASGTLQGAGCYLLATQSGGLRYAATTGYYLSGWGPRSWLSTALPALALGRIRHVVEGGDGGDFHQQFLHMESGIDKGTAQLRRDVGAVGQHRLLDHLVEKLLDERILGVITG